LVQKNSLHEDLKHGIIIKLRKHLDDVK
jgi:hypothetical protein